MPVRSQQLTFLSLNPPSPSLSRIPQSSPLSLSKLQETIRQFPSGIETSAAKEKGIMEEAMKESSAPGSSGVKRALLASATRDEIVVSLILLDLRNLIASLSESLSNFSWGRRRRRSCLDAPPPLPQPSPRLQKTDGSEIEVRKPHIESAAAAEDEKRHGDGGRTAASPDTPLSFSPCESDEKSNRPLKKPYKKRSREELIDTMDELTRRKDLLQGEIENVKKYYKKLKINNSQLKAIKQEVMKTYPIKGECQMEMPQHYHINAVSHPPPLIKNPTGQRFQSPFGQITARFHGLGSFNGVGPLGIDLNIPAEESALDVDSYRPLDPAYKRARFAEARRRRRGLIKIKAMRNACGIKLPTGR